jgi:membrane associated rhomboid family serine protease
LLAVCAVLAAGGDELRDLGRYDRQAIESGEYWRLVSGHLVHLGFGHVWPNLAALQAVTPFIKCYAATQLVTDPE